MENNFVIGLDVNAFGLVFCFGHYTPDDPRHLKKKTSKCLNELCLVWLQCDKCNSSEHLLAGSMKFSIEVYVTMDRYLMQNTFFLENEIISINRQVFLCVILSSNKL